MQKQFEFNPPIPAITYYNTTALTSSLLKDSIRSAEKQDAVILKIFIEAKTHLSPSDVLKYCEIKGFKYLITSVRRTINTLTNAGKLIHLPTTKMGPYGKPEGLWMIWIIK